MPRQPIRRCSAPAEDTTSVRHWKRARSSSLACRRPKHRMMLRRRKHPSPPSPRHRQRTHHRRLHRQRVREIDISVSLGLKSHARHVVTDATRTNAVPCARITQQALQRRLCGSPAWARHYRQEMSRTLITPPHPKEGASRHRSPKRNCVWSALVLPAKMLLSVLRTA